MTTPNQPHYGPPSASPEPPRYGPLTDRNKIFAPPPVRAGTGVKVVGNRVSIKDEIAREEAVAAAAATHPFLCPARSGNGKTVVGGTVNGVPSTNLTLDIGADDVVYLDISKDGGGDLFASSPNGYILGFAGALAVELASAASLPADSSTNIYRWIANYVSGAKDIQAVTTSLEVVARDDGTGTTTPTLIWGQS